MGATLVFQPPHQSDEANMVVVADLASAAAMADDLEKQGFLVIRIAGSQFSSGLDEFPFLRS